jgi:hypothetical protein
MANAFAHNVEKRGKPHEGLHNRQFPGFVCARHGTTSANRGLRATG